MASAPPDPGGGIGSPVSQAVSNVNRFLRRLTDVSTPLMTRTAIRPSPPSVSVSTSVRPGLTSEPQQQPQQPLPATNLVSPAASSQVDHRSRRSTDPEGSTGDEAVANLRAYAMTAAVAIDVEINAIHELEAIKTPNPKDDDVSTITHSKKLDPIESITKTVHPKITPPSASAAAHATKPPEYIFSSVPTNSPPHIPWITIVSDACRQKFLLNIPSRKVDEICADMNLYADGKDTKKFILLAEFLFEKAFHDMNPPPSLDGSSLSTGNTDVNVLETLSKVNDNMDIISQRLSNPSSSKVMSHDDKQVMN